MQVGKDGCLSCACGPCQAWKLYVKGALAGGPTWRQYEIWTQCYIAALAAYLRHAAWSEVCCWPCHTQHQSSHRHGEQVLTHMLCMIRDRLAGLGCVKVLEVGGGDGRLSSFLHSVVNELHIICTDSGGNKLHEASPYR